MSWWVASETYRHQQQVIASPRNWQEIHATFVADHDKEDRAYKPFKFRKRKKNEPSVVCVSELWRISKTSSSSPKSHSTRMMMHARVCRACIYYCKTGCRAALVSDRMAIASIVPFGCSGSPEVQVHWFEVCSSTCTTTHNTWRCGTNVRTAVHLLGRIQMYVYLVNRIYSSAP